MKHNYCSVIFTLKSLIVFVTSLLLWQYCNYGVTVFTMASLLQWFLFTMSSLLLSRHHYCDIIVTVSVTLILRWRHCSSSFLSRRLFVAKPPVGSVAGLKGEPISPELAIELKQLLFGNANRDFPVGWKGQAFEFNDRPMLKFGLVQHRGGPCGILAAVQAFILRFLVFPDDGKR